MNLGNQLWKDSSTNNDMNLIHDGCRLYRFSFLDYKTKTSFMKLLSTLLIYLYRVSEHYLLTNSSSDLKKGGRLLKNFPLEDYPLSTKMNNTLRSNTSFLKNNPKLDMKKDFRVIKNKTCTDISK